MRIRIVDELRFGAAVLLALAVTSIFGDSVAASVRPVVPQAAKSSSLVDKRMAFEVVSIRPRPAAGGGGEAAAPGQRGALPGGNSLEPCGGSILQITPGRFVANNITLYRLIAIAFAKSCRASSELGLILGGPAWIRWDRFDVQAVIPEGSPSYRPQQLADGQAPDLQMMIQTMVRERFKLVVHEDMKEGPAYNLVVVKPGKVKLSESQTPPAPSVPTIGRQGVRPDLSAPPSRMYSFRVDPSTRKATIVATSVTMSFVIDMFQGLNGRYVLDKTGFQGLIDIPSQTFDVGSTDAGLFGVGAASMWPEVLQLLGLKLEATRAPMKILAIDGAEKASDN